MGTFNDIRTRFELAVNENARTIEGAILPSLQKILGAGRINNKSGNKDIRFDLGGDEKSTLKKIEGAFGKLKLNQIKIDAVGAGDYVNGSNSGKFSTYIVTFLQDSKLKSLNIKSGDVIKIVDNNPPKGSIKSKELTPSVLGIPEDKPMKSSALESSVKNSIKKGYEKSNLFMHSFLIELFDLVNKYQPKSKFNSFNDIVPFSENIKYNEGIKEAISGLGATDLNTIGKDFGEVLGAALMLNIVKTSQGISFPSGNNPLVDFHIDGYGISSKYKAGAAPTLSNIIKDLKEENFTEDSEKKLYDLFKIIETNSVIDGYIKGAEFMDLSSAIKLKELVGNIQLDNKSLESFAQSQIADIGEEEFFYKYVKPLVDVAGRGSSNFNKVDWGKLRKNKRWVGLLSYPLSLQLIDKLNGRLGDGNLYIDTLKKIVSKLEVKQLYMDVSLKTEELLFYLKGFGDQDAKLTFEAPNVSAPNPGNGKLGFKMK
jgi:hypothetical protein